MKTIKNVKKGVLSFLGILLSPVLLAQEVDLNDLTDGMDDLRDTAFTIIEVIMIIAIVAGAIHVIVKLINNQEQSRGVVTGWIAAIVIYILVFQIFQ